MDGNTGMIYKRCVRCNIKLRRTKMKTKRLTFSNDELFSKHYRNFYLCGKHINTKSFLEAMWGDKACKVLTTIIKIQQKTNNNEAEQKNVQVPYVSLFDILNGA
jgi:hypothetical protein